MAATEDREESEEVEQEGDHRTGIVSGSGLKINYMPAGRFWRGTGPTSQPPRRVPINRGKKFFTSVGLAVLMLFGMAVPVHAITTLTSTPLFVPNGQALLCAITTYGPAVITITIQVLNAAGNVLDSGSDSISPGAIAVAVNPGPLTPAYCKFTGNFNRGFVRASAAQIRNNGATLVVVPAQAVGQ